jgi:hypothetical protein
MSGNVSRASLRAVRPHQVAWFPRSYPSGGALATVRLPRTTTGDCLRRTGDCLVVPRRAARGTGVAYGRSDLSRCDGTLGICGTFGSYAIAHRDERPWSAGRCTPFHWDRDLSPPGQRLAHRCWALRGSVVRGGCEHGRPYVARAVGRRAIADPPRAADSTSRAGATRAGAGESPGSHCATRSVWSGAPGSHPGASVRSALRPGPPVRSVDPTGRTMLPRM